MSNKLAPTYLVDSDVFVNIRDAHNSSEEIWKKIFQLIERGEIKTVPQVLGELERRFKPVYLKIKPLKKKILVPDNIVYSDAVVQEIRAIQQNHPRLYKPLGDNNSADPFLIATAKDLRASVVTDEAATGERHQSKIPYVCSQRKVACINRFAFFTAIGCEY